MPTDEIRYKSQLYEEANNTLTSSEFWDKFLENNGGDYSMETSMKIIFLDVD